MHEAWNFHSHKNSGHSSDWIQIVEGVPSGWPSV